MITSTYLLEAVRFYLLRHIVCKLASLKIKRFLAKGLVFWLGKAFSMH
nr:MAG TPA: hypothetical protein [Caudoviricetes sp.]